MILNTTSKAGDSSLISSGFNSNDWQKEKPFAFFHIFISIQAYKLDTSHKILHRKNNFGELNWWNN